MYKTKATFNNTVNITFIETGENKSSLMGKMILFRIMSINFYLSGEWINQRVRNDGVVSQIFLLTQSVFEMSPPRLWELQS